MLGVLEAETTNDRVAESESRLTLGSVDGELAVVTGGFEWEGVTEP